MLFNNPFTHCRRSLSSSAFRRGRTLAVAVALAVAGVFSSCTDKYDLDEKTPSNWGASIYDCLKDRGNFQNMVRIIDDLGYAQVLGQTGSKTLFCANDDAFNAFYQSNAWGVGSYEQLSPAQKKLILFGSMINNSYQLNYLANTEGNVEGNCMRRASAIGSYDTIPLMRPSEMPETKYWQRYRDREYLVCMQDMSNVPIVHFIEKYLANHKMTNEDYDFLNNHNTSRQAGEATFNGCNVIEEDVRCSNGFINVVDKVLTPLPNMAELIARQPDATIFSHMLDRFAAPYYIGDQEMEAYNAIDANVRTDSVFEKKYFSEKSRGGEVTQTPDQQSIPGKLSYDPGWNSLITTGANSALSAETALQQDMAMMTVPTDAALTEYFNNGPGIVLKERYGSWDNVPEDVIQELINNNMHQSLVNSVPSKFGTMLNDANDPLGIEEKDIERVELGCNGALYMTNRVFSPTTYVSVMYPCIVNENLKILRWGVENQNYSTYLNSLNSRYSFFVPSNGAMLTYIDPVAYGQTQTLLLEFHYDDTKANENDKVYADVYPYDILTHQKLSDEPKTRYGSWQCGNRLKNILYDHIVIGDVEDGAEYYRTMGGAEIRVKNTAAGDAGMTVEGSYQINEGEAIPVSRVYDQTLTGNGKTYILDSEPILGTQKTVVDILDEHEEFAEFRALLDASGVPVSQITKKACGTDHNIGLFSFYHYTVYVPTNESIIAYQNAGKLPTVQQLEDDELAVEEDPDNLEARARKTADSARIVNFVKYHIQDNAHFIGDNTQVTEDPANQTDNFYETFTIDPKTEKFYRVKLYQKDGSGMKIKDNAGQVRRVITTPGLYNLMAREYVLDNESREKSTNIETSASAVVHLIDGVLEYDAKQVQAKPKSKSKKR